MYSEFIHFVRELYKNKDGFIPLHEPRFIGNEKKYLNECLASTFVSSVGKFVGEFEKKVAEFTGAGYAVATVNGTAALHIALLLAGVEKGDEIITQPLTFVATVNAIVYTGAKPFFIDVDRDTLGLSPDKLENFLRNNTYQVEYNRGTFTYNTITRKRIKACVPMHTFGHPARIEEIKKITDQYNISLVEDAAESLGSYYLPREISGGNRKIISGSKGKHTGTFGLMGTMSFNGNKIITTGGGGMIITDDEALAKKAKHLTTQAKVPHKWEYVHDYIGYNYRLTNLAAALGVAQMEQLPGFIHKKRALAEKYIKFFQNMDIGFFTEPKNTKSNYWLNAIVLKNKKQRDDFLEHTNSNGVMTRPVWELMNRLEMYKNCQTADLTNAEWLADRLVNIPSSVI